MATLAELRKKFASKTGRARPAKGQKPLDPQPELDKPDWGFLEGLKKDKWAKRYTEAQLKRLGRGRHMEIGVAKEYRRLECATGGSDKYWEVVMVKRLMPPPQGHEGERVRYQLWRHFGASSTTPHLAERAGRWEEVASNADPDVILREMSRLVSEKKRKRRNYKEVKSEFSVDLKEEASDDDLF